jgi:hypothetical protein
MTRLLALACVLLGLVANAAGAASTNDPLFAKQWGLQQINADEAWRSPPARVR